MFIGHFGVAFAARRIAPRVSLGTAFLAAQFLDLLWPTFLLLGWERVRIEPGATAVTPLVFEHYPFSHSLLAASGWALAFAALYALATRRIREALVLAALVVSHWLLDLLVHAPDLPLAPGASPAWGMGLWDSVGATLLLEVPLFLAGVWLYARATRAPQTGRRVGLWALVATLAVIHAGNLAGAPPPSATAIAWVGQAQWLLVAWAYWVDRRSVAHRP